MEKLMLVIVSLTMLLALSGCEAAETPTPESSESITETISEEAPASQTEEIPALETPEVSEAPVQPLESTGETLISLSDSGTVISGSGAAAEGNIITISKKGTYTVSGSLSDGQLVVAAGTDDDIFLVLDGANIACSFGPAIYASQSDNLTITLKDGTESFVSDGTEYALAEGEDEPNAAIFSKDDIIINGTGSLVVNGSFFNGIGTKDDLEIQSGSITVTAANDALRGRDSITVTGGKLSLTAGGDGIRSNNDVDAGKGYIELENAIITINSTADGINADDYVLIKSGQFSITAGDDAIHSDTVSTINDGQITVLDCYEGIEGAAVFITGGTIDITARDDGVNSGGGNDNFGMSMYGEDTFELVDATGDAIDRGITVSGGSVKIYSDGDCIDSNGFLTMSGGVFDLYCTGNSNTCFDVDGTYTNNAEAITTNDGSEATGGGMMGGGHGRGFAS